MKHRGMMTLEGSGGAAQRVLDRSIRWSRLVSLMSWSLYWQRKIQVPPRQEVQLATQLTKIQTSVSPPTIATRPSADHNTHKTKHIRGVFKKRPNFLNSAPTSTDSALRLLSAPSLRLWQQTVICPASLGALVVELHPLNWARALAVRRISDKVTMKELEEQRVCVCVCVCVKFVSYAFELLRNA